MSLDEKDRPFVAYLVHDLNDAAVCRRLELMREEGMAVKLGGFRRQEERSARVETFSAVDLGRTRDARLLQRAASIGLLLMFPCSLRKLCAGAGAIVARNLEMLILAWRVRQPGQRLVYECLDIHRLMLGCGRKSRAMRWIERRLLSGTDLVIVSSPAFAQDYFAQRQGRRDGVLLVENKLPHRPGQKPRSRPDRQPDGACTIGWFGMLRCRKSLEQLAALAAGSAGRIQVVIAGRPSPAEFADFADEVSRRPGLRYLGPYGPEDLPRLYALVDFVWAIDYFEEGLNSAWLLPNRLYEGLAHGAVPIALRSVETGRWLHRRGVGLLVQDPLAELPVRLAALAGGRHAALRQAIAELPQAALYQTRDERCAIASAIVGCGHG
ncbi:glycosyltransferase [Novosphingobium soli]|uniref:Glycosyltransferase n=1 Tax=Novosphingobium soli TaxID=574956 RepID=A0ABV6CQ13_9SPHN